MIGVIKETIEELALSKKIFIEEMKLFFTSRKKVLLKESGGVDALFPWEIREGGLTLIFKRKKDRNNFIERGGLVPTRKGYPFNERVLGEFLHYPPQAILDYGRGTQDTGVHYNGMNFVVERSNLESSIEFLDENLGLINNRQNVYWWDLDDQCFKRKHKQ